MEYEEKELIIEGCNKTYIITNEGQIYDPSTGKYRKLREHRKGYLKCSFMIHGKYKLKFVHRLVMMVFNPVENMENLQVNHIDGNKQNNRLDNLEWCTGKENARHAKELGLWNNCTPYGDKSHHHKLTSEIVSEIKYYLNHNYSYSKLSKMYNISIPTIYQISNEITWKSVKAKETLGKSSTTR